MSEQDVPLDQVFSHLPPSSAVTLQHLLAWIGEIRCVHRTTAPGGYVLVGPPGPHAVSTSVHPVLGASLVQEFEQLLIDDAR